ncbi:MAG: F0F1 ATP synthase subunit delta [Gemmatimonadaceae bacterium]
MREPTIASNYAEALVALARKADDLSGWGKMIQDVASAIQHEEKLRQFLEAPRVTAQAKNEIIARAFQDRYPRLFVKFLQAVISHRRQKLIPEIAIQYERIVDVEQNRVHAEVTVAYQPDASAESEIASGISKALGKTVVPHFTVRPEILGGLIVRVGDSVMDGSVRKRLSTLRGKLMAGSAT